MAGLFNTTPSPRPLPSFLGGPAPVAPQPAAVPPMALTSWTPTQAAQLQAVQLELQRIQLELQQLIGQLASVTPQPAPPPPSTSSWTGVLGQAWQSISQFLGFQPAPVPPTPTNPPTANPPKANGPTDFVISSFNVLSTGAGKGKGFANAKDRMRWTMQILDQHNVSVVGFQEMAADQLKEFKRIAGDKYGTFAGASGKKGYHDTTLAWRKDTWDLVKADTITVPSYAGQPSKVPYVRLRNKQTGQEAYFVDVHNPANTKRYHHQDRFRNEAAQKETALVKRLMEQHGLPVFLVGDFNSVEPARNIVTQGAPVTAANAQTGKRAGIDWIFGSKGVKFSQFSRTRDGLINKTTDHPVLFSKVHIR
jgi:Endonuclease/Exonuclease/phosphatase family